MAASGKRSRSPGSTTRGRVSNTRLSDVLEIPVARECAFVPDTSTLARAARSPIVAVAETPMLAGRVAGRPAG